MFNTIEYAKIFQRELDKKMVHDSVTGWMEPNAKLVKYSGGKEVKVPTVVMDGLADYDRDDGYAKGAVTLEWKTYELKKDRGRKFFLDKHDVDETNFVLSAGLVMGEFQRTRVVPEVDAYRISRLAELAGQGRARTYTPADSSILKELQADIGTVRDKAGDSASLVILMSIPVSTMLNSSTALAKKLDVTTFDRGEIKLQVQGIDGIPILRVSSNLMQTKIELVSGRSEEDQEGGFKTGATSKAINWIVCKRSAPVAISKTDTVRIFDPITHQDAHSWRVDYRKYHDLWLLENQKDGVLVNTK